MLSDRMAEVLEALDRAGGRKCLTRVSKELIDTLYEAGYIITPMVIAPSMGGRIQYNTILKPAGRAALAAHREARDDQT